MKSVQITRDDMKEIMDFLPEELKSKFLGMVKPASGIEVLRRFVDQYDDEHMFDHILSSVVCNIIGRVCTDFNKLQQDMKEKGIETVNSVHLGYVVMDNLKAEFNNISVSLEKFEAEDASKQEPPKNAD